MLRARTSWAPDIREVWRLGIAGHVLSHLAVGSPASAHWSVRDFEPSLRPGIIGKIKKMKKKVIHLF